MVARSRRACHCRIATHAGTTAPTATNGQRADAVSASSAHRLTTCASDQHRKGRHRAAFDGGDERQLADEERRARGIRAPAGIAKAARERQPQQRVAADRRRAPAPPSGPTPARRQLALHDVTTTAAAIVPATCMVATRLHSAAALVPRVIAASAAKSGHGGSDHVRSVASSAQEQVTDETQIESAGERRLSRRLGRRCCAPTSCDRRASRASAPRRREATAARRRCRRPAPTTT